MAKRVKMPGRVESAEVGGIVTGAGEILDDDKGKKQSVINSEVEAELVRLENEKQDNITVDSVPTEGSVNPVSSGAVYTADKALSDAIEAILLLIPSAASALNQLADKTFVRDSVSTATATFRGTYNVVSDLHLSADASHSQIEAALDDLSLGADTNDYCFVQVPDSESTENIKKTERYKFNGTGWAYEYDLNNSGFTTAQWEAINSNITALLVTKLSQLPTNEVLTALLAAKQNNLTFDDAPTSGSNNPAKSGGIYARNNEIVELINALDAAKQDVLTFDSIPINGSENPVTSGGVYEAIYLVQVTLAGLDGRMLSMEHSIEVLTENVGILRTLYQSLSQSDIIVGAKPTTGVANIIYRVPGSSTFADWMYYNGAWVKLAEYTTLDGYLYKGIATPNGSPAASAVKMFYFALTPGTYTNFGNLVVKYGINILKYDGANWTLENLGNSDGVFDITEYSGSSFASLQALLSDANLNNLIPVGVRKGGMSIKFVCSIDNKYVQYRYMPDDATTVATFTNIKNWQGVDTEPTAMSNNLITSGGSYEILANVQDVENKFAIGANLFNKNSTNIITGYIGLSSGIPVRVNDENCNISHPILVKKGVSYKYKHSSYLGSNLITPKCDNKGDFTGFGYINGTLDDDFIVFTPDTDCFVLVNLGKLSKDSFMVCESQSYPANYVSYKVTLNDVTLSDSEKEELINESVSESMDGVDNNYFQTINSINLFNKDSSDILNGYLYVSGGVAGFNLDNSYKVTHIIHFEAGKTYKCLKAAGVSDIYAIAACITDGELNGSYILATLSDEFQIFAPQEDVDVRINIGRSSLSTFMVCESEEYPEEYVPYFREDSLKDKYHLNNTQKEEVNRIANPLIGKLISLNGDSICYGNGYLGGYGKIIADRNSMQYENIAVGGGVITSGVAYCGTIRHCICETILNMDEDADYAIFEGGVNDASLFNDELVALGSITPGYTDTLDKTTFYGAMETLCKNAIAHFSKAKLGFVIVHKCTALYDNRATTNSFYKAAVEVLEKWGIPYCDLNINCPPLRSIESLRVEYTTNGDGWHPTEEGYLRYYCDKIESWMKTL